MMNRVTQGIMNTQLLRNLNHNLTRMTNSQEQLSTSRRINRPSDDPVGLSYGLRYRSELSANEQYLENVTSANSWLDYTDTMLNQVGNVMNRVRELAVQGSNGTNSEESMNAMKSEVSQLKEQLVTIANQQFNGKYIFNGQKTDEAPYNADGTPANGVAVDAGMINFSVGVGTTVAVNVTGTQVFGAKDDSDNSFKVLDDLIGALGKADTAGVSDALKRLDTRNSSFLVIRADVGAKTNRIELAGDRLDDSGMNLQTLQSKVEDADMAKVMTNMNTDQSVYQASLSTGAQIIRTSLVDFLK